MPLSDRDSFIALLDRLGSPEDAVALAAARDVDAQVRREGLSWDTLLVRPVAANDDDDDDAPGHVHAAAEEAAAPPIGDTTADISAIDRLMAVKDLSADTREMLQDLKDDIAAGNFTDADRRYIRSLEIRLAAGKKK